MYKPKLSEIIISRLTFAKIRLVMKKIFVLGIFFSLAFAGCSNKDVVEVKETSDPAEYLIAAITEVYSTFDVLDDFISSNDLLRKKDELLIPNSVEFELIDSLFIDGDGIEFSLDFGALGQSEPYGVLCKDGKYRAGKIHVYISDNYKNTNAEVAVNFSEDEPFYTGNGSEMLAFAGEINIEKQDVLEFRFRTDELRMFTSDQKLIRFSCDNELRKTYDPGIGILNDRIEIDGKFEMLDPSGVTYKAEVTQSLKKNYENSCIKNIVEGKIGMEVHSASLITADFDPYSNQACDNIVEITINNKSFIYEY